MASYTKDTYSRYSRAYGNILRDCMSIIQSRMPPIDRVPTAPPFLDCINMMQLLRIIDSLLPTVSIGGHSVSSYSFCYIVDTYGTLSFYRQSNSSRLLCHVDHVCVANKERLCPHRSRQRCLRRRGLKVPMVGAPKGGTPSRE